MTQPTILSLDEIYAPIQPYLPQVEEKILEILATPNELASDIIRYFFKSKGKFLRPALTLLTGMGFEFDEWSGNTFVIRACPVGLKTENLECIFRDFLGDLSDGTQADLLKNSEKY